MGKATAAAAAVPSLAEASLHTVFGAVGGPAGAGEPGSPLQLGTNQNAYGPSEQTIAAMRQALNFASRHPDAESEALRERIAVLHGVGQDEVVLGCGSGDILRMATNTFTGPQRKLVMALPTFGLISRYAAHAGAEVSSVPLRGDWSHDLQAMLARSDANTGLVYICNPNNPTGSLTSRDNLEAFLRELPSSIHVLIDEAYHHYVEQSSDYRSFIDRPLDDSRVIVVRSFSKIYGLGGMRIGYAVTSRRTADRLAFNALAGNVNVVAATAAAAALDDREHVERSRRLNADDRQAFYNQANARMLRTIDSQTNFVMVNTERQIGDVGQHFRKHNILLPRPDAPLDQYIRISLGTPAEMREFWRVWDLMPAHTMMSM